MARRVKESVAYPLLNNEAWLRQKYLVEEKIMREVAELAGGCSAAMVLHALRRFGIESRRGKAAMLGKTTKQPSFPLLYDQQWLAARRAEGKSASEVAKIVGCCWGAACKAYRRYGLVEPPLADVTQSPFYGQASRLKDRKWLAGQYIRKGRKAAHIAAELMVPTWAVQDAVSHFRLLKHPKRPQGKKDHALPAGVKRTSQGYLKELAPDHPSAGPRGYVSQHRLVIERAIGRFLTDEEQCHHINECRSDNRLDNLMLLPNYSVHSRIHHREPPPWVPRCDCCNRPRPELVAARPSWVPLVYDEALTYSAGPPDAAAATTPDERARLAATIERLRLDLHEASRRLRVLDAAARPSGPAA